MIVANDKNIDQCTAMRKGSTRKSLTNIKFDFF